MESLNECPATRIGIRVDVVRLIDPGFPGVVECQFMDAHGRRWLIVEKVPVVSRSDLGPSTTFPQPGVIACEVTERIGGLARIDTSRPWGVESVEGETRFEVPLALLVEE